MDSKEDLLFVSFSSKKNKKDIFKKQSKYIYWWKLERLKVIDKDNSIDVFPSTPPFSGIQKFKEEIIFLLNKQKKFDFEYLPKENDYLSIHLNESNFLNLVFKDNAWIEEYYSCFYRNPFDEYDELNKGKVDLRAYQ